MRWITRRLDRHDDRGLTLPEMLVTITLMTVVMGSLVGAVVTLTRAIGSTNAANTDLGVARTTANRLAQQLRGAVGPEGELDINDVAFVVADRTRVAFYSNLGVAPGDGPDLVYFQVLANGDLRERIWDARGSSPPYSWANPARTDRIIARDLQSQDVFRYFTHRELNAPCGREINSASALNADDREEVDSVEFRLQVRGESSYTNDTVQLTGRTRLANAVDIGRIQDYTTWESLPDSARYCS